MPGVIMQNLADFRPLALGLLVWVLHFVWALNNQSATRRAVRLRVLKQLKEENGGEPVKLPGIGTLGFMRNHPRILEDVDFIRADRTFVNQVEQAPLFLIGVALFVLLVDVRVGGQLALLYAVLRCFYFKCYDRPLLTIALVTGPNYIIAVGMTVSAVYRVFS